MRYRIGLVLKPLCYPYMLAWNRMLGETTSGPAWGTRRQGVHIPVQGCCNECYTLGAKTKRFKTALKGKDEKTWNCTEGQSYRFCPHVYWCKIGWRLPAKLLHYKKSKNMQAHVPHNEQQVTATSRMSTSDRCWHQQDSERADTECWHQQTLTAAVASRFVTPSLGKTTKSQNKDFTWLVRDLVRLQCYARSGITCVLIAMVNPRSEHGQKYRANEHIRIYLKSWKDIFPIIINICNYVQACRAVFYDSSDNNHTWLLPQVQGELTTSHNTPTNMFMTVRDAKRMKRHTRNALKWLTSPRRHKRVPRYGLFAPPPPAPPGFRGFFHYGVSCASPRLHVFVVVYLILIIIGVSLILEILHANSMELHSWLQHSNFFWFVALLR